MDGLELAIDEPANGSHALGIYSHEQAALARVFFIVRKRLRFQVFPYTPSPFRSNYRLQAFGHWPRRAAPAQGKHVFTFDQLLDGAPDPSIKSKK